MIQKLHDVMAVSLICPSDIVIGEPVVMSDDLTVAAISGTGQVVGVV